MEIIKKTIRKLSTKDKLIAGSALLVLLLSWLVVLPIGVINYDRGKVLVAILQFVLVGVITVLNVLTLRNIVMSFLKLSSTETGNGNQSTISLTILKKNNQG